MFKIENDSIYEMTWRKNSENWKHSFAPYLEQEFKQNSFCTF